MADQGSYLYAVAGPLPDAVVDGIRGIDGAAVRPVRDGDLTAVVSTVDLADFGEESLRQHLGDPEWLEAVARAHHGVVDEVARHATVAPLRLATVCADDNGVRDRLGRWRDALHRTLADVAGCAEWSVKLYPSPPDDPDRAGEAEPDALSGAEYLRRRKAAVTHRQDAAQTAAAVAEDVHGELSRHAVAARRLAVHDPRVTGSATPMTLNGAYLVADGEADLFRTAMAALAERHGDTRVEVAGPWPPYSFVTVEPA
ncbi:GvpL/GvpF family gas vesicle protein [Jiangella asiatica]|uniref:GvpL/GvpF family gas vesicle protein n=1 Tax=Jiangella asiatica TaxID=2530372 RepID=A0A4V2YZZ4_9ACTN|nr:GvpL/GvpF family gas vesicle protein [Jiangella asiatica]TDD99037.1 GvpL/GvpF family gas vesicle protein [Jiangella asiatica]